MIRRLLRLFCLHRPANQSITICGYCGPSDHTTRDCPNKAGA